MVPSALPSQYRILFTASGAEYQNLHILEIGHRNLLPIVTYKICAVSELFHIVFEIGNSGAKILDVPWLDFTNDQGSQSRVAQKPAAAFQNGEFESFDIDLDETDLFRSRHVLRDIFIEAADLYFKLLREVLSRNQSGVSGVSLWVISDRCYSVRFAQRDIAEFEMEAGIQFHKSLESAVTLRQGLEPMDFTGCTDR